MNLAQELREEAAASQSKVYLLLAVSDLTCLWGVGIVDLHLTESCAKKRRS